MNEAYSSFPADRRRRFGVKLLLTASDFAGLPVVDGWPGLVASCSRSWVVRGGRHLLLLPPRPGDGGNGLGPSPDRCRGLWSREWRSSCGCLMLWSGRGSARAGLCSGGGAGPKDHAFSRCLTGADGVIRFRTG